MLTRPFRMLLPGVFMLLAAVASPAAAALHSPSAANVLFKAKTTVLMTVEGRSSDLSVSDDGTTVALKVPVKSLTTGIALRDRHMRETLEADRFPNVELRVERKALVFPAANQEKSGNASGQLTLHGQTRPVNFTYRARREGARYQVSGSMPVDLKAHGVKPPSYAGVTVKPQVEVTTSFMVED